MIPRPVADSVESLVAGLPDTAAVSVEARDLDGYRKLIKDLGLRR